MKTKELFAQQFEQQLKEEFEHMEREMIMCPACNVTMTKQEVRYDLKDDTIFVDKYACDKCRYIKN